MPASTNRLAWRGLILAAGGTLAMAASAPSGLAALAGHYARTWQSGDVGGGKFMVTDEVVIEPTAADSANVSLSLNFFNGHMCDIEGEARMKHGKLVLLSPENNAQQGPPCRLELWREGKWLRWSDGAGTCHVACGARGNLSDGRMALRYRKAPARP